MGAHRLIAEGFAFGTGMAILAIWGVPVAASAQQLLLVALGSVAVTLAAPKRLIESARLGTACRMGLDRNDSEAFDEREERVGERGAGCLQPYLIPVDLFANGAGEFQHTVEVRVLLVEREQLRGQYVFE